MLVEAYMNGIAVNGDFYRYNAQVVAAAASMGLLTTETREGSFGRQYRVTGRGLDLMDEWRGECTSAQS